MVEREIGHCCLRYTAGLLPVCVSYGAVVPEGSQQDVVAQNVRRVVVVEMTASPESVCCTVREAARENED